MRVEPSVVMYARDADASRHVHVDAAEGVARRPARRGRGVGLRPAGVGGRWRRRGLTRRWTRHAERPPARIARGLSPSRADRCCRRAALPWAAGLARAGSGVVVSLGKAARARAASRARLAAVERVVARAAVAAKSRVVVRAWWAAQAARTGHPPVCGTLPARPAAIRRSRWLTRVDKGQAPRLRQRLRCPARSSWSASLPEGCSGSCTGLVASRRRS